MGLGDEIEPDERALLATPLGGLADRQRSDAGRRTEGLAVLAWALGRYELPAYDVQANGPDGADSVGLREEREQTALHAPHLRAKEELSALADQRFSLHWRLRQFSLDRAALDFPAVARKSWFPLPLEGLRLSEGDLEVPGVPLFRAPESPWREAMSIAREHCIEVARGKGAEDLSRRGGWRGKR